MKKFFSYGFTVTEVLISTAIVSGVGLIVAILLDVNSRQFLQTQERLEAELEGMKGEYLFRTFLSQAVDVSNQALPAPPFNLGAGSGGVQAVDYRSIGDLAGNWATIALFVREHSGQVNAEAYGSRPMRSAIFYRKPSVNTTGVIFFKSSAAVNGNMSPDFGDPYIDRVTELQVRKVFHPTYPNRLTNVRVTFKLRYHTQNLQALNWCPNDDIKNGAFGCAAVADSGTQTIERDFMVVLRNNFIAATGMAGGGEERTMSDLYFFKLTNPTSWR